MPRCATAALIDVSYGTLKRLVYVTGQENGQSDLDSNSGPFAYKTCALPTELSFSLSDFIF